MHNKIGGSDGIMVPEYITGQCPPHYGFPADRLKEVHQKPDATDVLKWDDLEIRFFLKREPKFTDVIAIQWTPLPRQVAYAFRAFPSLCDTPLAELTPLKIIEKIVERFGLEATIAGKKGKFFLRENVNIPPGAVAEQLVQIANPDNHEFAQSFYLKPNPPVISIAMAFCLDTREYGKWLVNH